MPCDNQWVHVAHDEFIDTLNCLEQLMCRQNYDAFIICGDYNTSFQHNNSHTLSLWFNFMERNELNCVLDHVYASQDNTYVNHELNHESCIDHYLVTDNMYYCVTNSFVSISSLNPSHHHLIHLSLNIPHHISIVESKYNYPDSSIDWNKVDMNHVALYQQNLMSYYHVLI